jgi:predicted transcriptional regulator
MKAAQRQEEGMKIRTKKISGALDQAKKLSKLNAEIEKLKQEQGELEEKYHNTIEYANDAILTTDSRGRISSFNRKA